MKLNKKQEQEIIKLAFYEELSKNAGLEVFLKGLAKLAPGAASKVGKISTEASNFIGAKNLPKYFSEASAAFAKSKGKGFEFLKSHADSDFVQKGKKVFYGKKGIEGVGRVGDTSGFVQRVVGNTAKELEFLGKGIKSTNPVSQNISQLGSNIVGDIKRQLTNARFKTFDKANIGRSKSKKFEVKTINGKKFITKKNGKIFKNREILGYDSKNNPITKKRSLGQAAAIAGTPVGFAAISAATGEPEEGMKDYMKWKTPVGPAELMYDIVNPGE